MALKIMFTDLGKQDFGGYGSLAEVEGDAGAAGQDVKLDPVDADTYNDPARTLVIPVSPESIEIKNGIDIEAHSTPFFAELITLSGIKLRTFDITSFFPYDTEYGVDEEIQIQPQKYYISWIQNVMLRKKILLFSIYGDIDYIIPFSCVITDFSYTIGAYKDIDYTITVSEYIDYRNQSSTRKFVTDGDMLITSSTKNRPNLDGGIVVGSIVRVVSGIAHINSLGTQYLSVQGISSLYRNSPRNFMSINTLFEAQQLAKEIDRSADMEWVVVSITPKSLYSEAGPREFYQSLCSNPIGINNLLNINIVSLSTSEDGWVTKSQLALVR